MIVFTGKARLLVYPETQETVPGKSAPAEAAPEKPASEETTQ